jgi:hypothetical protein
MLGDRAWAPGHDGGRVGVTVAEFFFDYIWPLIIMAADSVLPDRPHQPLGGDAGTVLFGGVRALTLPQDNLRQARKARPV